MSRGVLPLAVLLLAGQAWATAPSVVASPERLLLGSGQTVELKVVGDGRPVRAHASVGTLVSIDAPDGSEASFVWTPPDLRYPLTAVLLFWTQAEAPGDVAMVRIALLGRTDLKIATEPRARVRVKLGGASFGPVQADGRGQVSIPIEVPPDFTRATVLVDAGGAESTREVPIDVPETHPVAVSFASESVRPDGEARLIVAQARGGADEPYVQVPDADVTPAGQTEHVRLYAVRPRTGATALAAQVSTGEHRSSATISVRAEAAEPEPPPVDVPQAVPFAHLGGFIGGGANAGPSLSVGAGRHLPWLAGRLLAELEVGLRTAGLSSEVAGLGGVQSRIVAVPLLLVARYRVLERGALTGDVRAGGGVAIFSHSVTAAFQPPFSEGGVRPAGILGITCGWRLGELEPFAELRGEWAPIRTRLVQARVGGAFLSLGARYSL